jgi:hypothetical protein
MNAHRKKTKHGTSKRTFYDSISQASVTLNISQEVLKAAKAAGCPNFKSSRVYVDGLKKWIADHAAAITPEQDKATLKDQKLREEVRKLKLANDVKEGKLVERSRVVASWQRASKAIVSALRQRLENEYPTGVAGLEPAQARVYGKRLVDLCISDIRAAADVWDY